ncbi:PH domain-containing protein [Shewanella waksmanii]|uniref:PH domain-containing protein n=1 Tax=Shewanella waksmanii TaxID=213783 RepID=UPI0004BBDFD9|nr:PH domain-containing protein [Shewanella waksmanii]
MHSESMPTPPRANETPQPQQQWLSFDQLPLIAVDQDYIKQVNTENLIVALPLLTLAVVVPVLINVPILVLLAIVTLMLIVLGCISYLRFCHAKSIHFGVFEDELVMQKGVIWRKKTALPYSRLQHVTLSQGPIERHFAQHTLKCFSAGSGHAEISLPGINTTSAEPMRQHLLAKAALRQKTNLPLAEKQHNELTSQSDTQSPTHMPPPKAQVSAGNTMNAPATEPSVQDDKDSNKDSDDDNKPL